MRFSILSVCLFLLDEGGSGKDHMESKNPSSKETRNAVVTGGNKGIGLEICRQLASTGVLIVLTARDEQRGKEAAENLKASGLLHVVFHQLDVKDPDSICKLAKFIETEFGKLDILVGNTTIQQSLLLLFGNRHKGALKLTILQVNNAGHTGATINWDAFTAFINSGQELSEENSHLLNIIMDQTYEEAEECLKTNYYGTKGVTEALLPLLQQSPSARIVNVSSDLGQLKLINNEKIKVELENVDQLTAEKLDRIIEQFLGDFKEQKLQENGWPLILSAYKASKVVINAYTRFIASKYPSLRVNCVHPGYVKTDMTSNTGTWTAEDGARPAVMLALLSDDGPSGLYFDRMSVASF